MDAIYAPFIRPFLQACKGHMIPIILDESATGYHCQMLVAAAGYQHRALPLAWSARKGQKGHFPAADHLDVTQRVTQLVPEDTDIVIYCLSATRFTVTSKIAAPRCHNAIHPSAFQGMLPSSPHYDDRRPRGRTYARRRLPPVPYSSSLAHSGRTHIETSDDLCRTKAPPDPGVSSSKRMRQARAHRRGR